MAQRFVIAFAACVAGAAAVWLAHAIDSDPQRSWLLPLAAGVVITALVAWFAMLGTRITVDADGILTYSLHGRANLAVDLRAATAIRPVASGMIAGVGLSLRDPAQVRFLHKAGISPERMRRWREDLAVDLLLEGFSQELATELAALRDRLPAAVAGVPGAPA